MGSSRRLVPRPRQDKKAEEEVRRCPPRSVVAFASFYWGTSFWRNEKMGTTKGASKDQAPSLKSRASSLGSRLFVAPCSECCRTGALVNRTPMIGYL